MEKLSRLVAPETSMMIRACAQLQEHSRIAERDARGTEGQDEGWESNRSRPRLSRASGLCRCEHVPHHSPALRHVFRQRRAVDVRRPRRCSRFLRR